MFFSYVFYCCPDPLWRWSNSTSIFFRWVGEKKHQLVTFFFWGVLPTYDPFSTLRSPQARFFFEKITRCIRHHQCWSLKVWDFWWRDYEKFFLGKVIFPSQKWLIQRRWAMIFAIYAICLGRCCVTIWSTSPRSRKGHDLMFGLVSEWIFYIIVILLMVQTSCTSWGW